MKGIRNALVLLFVCVSSVLFSVYVVGPKLDELPPTDEIHPLESNLYDLGSADVPLEPPYVRVWVVGAFILGGTNCVAAHDRAILIGSDITSECDYQFVVGMPDGSVFWTVMTHREYEHVYRVLKRASLEVKER